MRLVTRDRSTGLRRGPIRYPDGHPPVPSGCRWCGVPDRQHARRWSGAVGWHPWTPPTPAQALARMRARRATRTAPQTDSPTTDAPAEDSPREVDTTNLTRSTR
ncbi:hypothetical protein OIE91_11470 [Streptomyces albidoflavus]|uniref:hypothetical protein n=1 Tax=Streptomyces albidoflavus TaxID=1886 RepID=UPI00352C4065